MPETASAQIIPVGLQLISAATVDSAEVRMIRRWQSEYEKLSQRRRRRESILAAISDGYDTISEITSETGIPAATARRIIAKFAAARRVEVTRTINSNRQIEYRYSLT